MNFAVAVIFNKTSTSVQTTPPMTATREAVSTQLEATAVTAIQATRDVYVKQVRLCLCQYLKSLALISSWNTCSMIVSPIRSQNSVCE